MTLLIADYMNMIGRTSAPGTLSSLPATPKARMTPSRSSSRARGGILTTAPNTPRPDHRDIIQVHTGASPSHLLTTRDLNATPRLSRKWSHLTSVTSETSQTNWRRSPKMLWELAVIWNDSSSYELSYRVAQIFQKFKIKKCCLPEIVGRMVFKKFGL